ncbi:MAG: hypothetical protein AAGH45_01885 [Pseudomonadota bacterium]
MTKRVWDDKGTRRSPNKGGLTMALHAHADDAKTDLESIAEGYVPALLSGQANTLIELVGDGARIEDARFPGISGADAIGQFVQDFNAWITPMSPRYEHVRTTKASRRVLSECMVHLNDGSSDWSLPVGIVTSRDEDGSIRVHVYYTNWPFNKGHAVRKALFRDPLPDQDAFDGHVKHYIQCLLTADLDRIVEAWEADIYFREPSGLPYVHWGKNNVVTYFSGLFANGAPMLRDDTVNQGERTVFMEFSIIGWNGVEWPEEKWQAGLASYECTSRHGLMRAIRIYDDVEF